MAYAAPPQQYTPQQLQQIQAMQLRQQQENAIATHQAQQRAQLQAQAAQARQTGLQGQVGPPPAATGAAAAAGHGGLPPGVTSREREAGDGDDAYRNAKRRKPTDRTLPSTFKPSVPDSLFPSPTDKSLESSLSSLSKLSASYKRLQEIERRMDWTFARKGLECEESVGTVASGNAKGQAFKRTLRVHVVAALKDQSWQLSTDELADVAKATDESAEAVKPEDGENKLKEEEVKPKADRVPRVEIRLSGELLPDSRYVAPTAAAPPFTAYLHRLVLETPHRDPTVTPVSAQPLSWTRPVAPASVSSLPPALSASYPTSTSPLSLRLALYPAHPAGDRFAVHPDLARVLDLAESDRVGVLEAMWGYAKARGLVVEQPDAGAASGGTTAQSAGGIKSGIKTDERIAKFFGNVPMVAFHHIPEYLNRWFMPAAPRVVNFDITVTPDAPAEQHHAFDLELYHPSPARPALESARRSLSSLVSGTTPSATDLSLLDDKLATNCLATTQHLRQLHALMAFTRDPRGFLERWLESQAGSLEQILGTSATAAAGSASTLGEELFGPRWREEIRSAETWEDKEWVKEAVVVWASREKEGQLARVRAQAQQQQQMYAMVQGAQQQQMYGRR
ncbi:SWI/SNF-related matrix-associated actin-dependent regulatorof chromatin subfamily D [Rhodotorula toruloides]|uniref:SWI/SNF-related matrix-associated actin-dependent regulatorof chromatin subfamily D n=1 Tax=Rhodotorula toruloides TaxID=5286 RepID=A0A511KPJ3_RHOTO|nr:SWI/SNF-related matrix-associated actin-dependent regulatorof chromatin subfamily D [Rhodotorula toruloides]